MYIDAYGAVEVTTTSTTLLGDTNAYGQNGDFRYGNFDTLYSSGKAVLRNDVFWATGNFDPGNPYNKKWYVSYNGTQTWKAINSSYVGVDRIALQDFDGNGKTDVYDVLTGKISYDGTTSWTLFSSVSGLAAGSVDAHAFGDYDGDGKADVFKKEINPNGTDFLKVSYGGTQNWVTAIVTDFLLGDLMFIDLGGDKTTDIVYKSVGVFKVSRGKGNFNSNYSWQTVAHRTFEHDDYFYGDFDGNGKTDQFRIYNGDWQVRYDGAQTFSTYKSNIGSDERTLSGLALGDFNGDGKADVFKRVASEEGRLKYWNLDSENWNNLASSEIALLSYGFGDFDGNGITDIIYRSADGSVKVSWDSRNGGQNLVQTGLDFSLLQFMDLTGNGYTDMVYVDPSSIRASFNSQQRWTNWDPAFSHGL